jgi:hypothetical protein
MMVPDTEEVNKEDKTCLICMDTTRNLIEEVNVIYNMPFLIKNCDCLCNIHYSCLEKWIKNNSVCPICRKAIISEKLLSENITTVYIYEDDVPMIHDDMQNLIQTQTYSSTQTPNQQIIYVVPNKATVCIQTIFLILFIFVLISLTNYFLI